MKGNANSAIFRLVYGLSSHIIITTPQNRGGRLSVTSSVKMVTMYFTYLLANDH